LERDTEGIAGRGERADEGLRQQARGAGAVNVQDHAKRKRTRRGRTRTVGDGAGDGVDVDLAEPEPGGRGDLRADGKVNLGERRGVHHAQDRRVVGAGVAAELAAVDAELDVGAAVGGNRYGERADDGRLDVGAGIDVQGAAGERNGAGDGGLAGGGGLGVLQRERERERAGAAVFDADDQQVVAAAEAETVAVGRLVFDGRG